MSANHDPTQDTAVANTVFCDTNDDRHEKPTRPIPMIVYTRSQLLALHNSPLVKPPSNMPELKDWFGADVEQIVLRKDAESSSNARDRRYRRDLEDGDTTSRPSFRSAVSQPSQMGNFKHQSLRAGDRDKERDRDVDRERERDNRDREGQERLRHLSDKYDRDRMALPASGLRGKERDGTSNSSSRLSSHTQTSALSSRRADGTKKKSGDEDWRRSGEPSRSGREERQENGRRDDRERPRSRARASSRSRRETSSTRRERDGAEKDRSSRGDRDDHRRDRDDKDLEYDDPRHWRDDGKREERIAAKRERGDKERASERDSAWESTSDRRWATEERDGRTKRSTRDRKAAQGDDAKDREERRDREREREKEKEPAWMDTYIPNGSSFGILGGKCPDGELDGIQAWKKGMKEKEQREREKEQGPEPSVGQGEPNADSSADKIDASEKQLDEIQLFKLLMKREEEKKKIDLSSGTIPIDPASPALNVSNGSYMTSAQEGVQPEKESHSALQSQLRTDDRLTAQSDPAELSGPPKGSGSGYMVQAGHPEKVNDEVIATYHPPSAPRLLSLGRPPASSIKSSGIGNPHSAPLEQLYNQYGVRPESSHPAPGFSPFEEPNRTLPVDDTLAAINAQDALRRPSKERPSPNIDAGHLYDANNAGYPGPRGSRFAKFFDKMREPPAPLPKPQTPVGLPLHSPHPNQRMDQNPHEPPHGEQRTLEDIFNMLSNSSQGHRSVVSSPLALANNHPISQQTQNNLQLLQQAAFQQQQIQTGHRMEPLYESRLDDRSFVPDGMVPGLRTVPPPRSRDAPALYSDGLEEVMHHIQRPSQQRLDSVYAGPPPLYNPQRSVGIPPQQTQFRGGPSPISGQQGPLQNAQRLPPGLANLGGRPPHDPSHFMNLSGVPPPNMHGSLPLNGPPQQQNYNGFATNGGLGYNGPPLRGPLPAHQLQNLPNNLNPNQAQFLAMNGVGIGGLRGMNTGLTPQQGQSTQVHNPLLAMRQQPPLPAHALPHMIPPHISQQGMPGPTNQPAHDLMALLMGGPHRE